MTIPEATYTYRVICTPTETVVREERETAGLGAPLDTEGATYHRLFDEADPGAPNPVGVIECEDGSVFTYEDMIGRWDPKDPLPSIEDVDAELARRAGRPPEIDAIIRKVDADESDFFKRQLADVDTRVYAVKYPAAAIGLRSIGNEIAVVSKPSIWTRLKWFTYPFRAFLASWLIGRDVDAGEEY